MNSPHAEPVSQGQPATHAAAGFRGDCHPHRASQPQLLGLWTVKEGGRCSESEGFERIFQISYRYVRLRSSCSTTRIISDSGAGLPVQISNWRAPCCTNISIPLITCRPRDFASFSSGVSIGLYTMSKISPAFNSFSAIGRACFEPAIPQGVALIITSKCCFDSNSCFSDFALACLASVTACSCVRLTTSTSAPCSTRPNTAARAAPPAPSTTTRAPFSRRRRSKGGQRRLHRY